MAHVFSEPVAFMPCPPATQRCSMCSHLELCLSERKWCVCVCVCVCVCAHTCTGCTYTCEGASGLVIDFSKTYATSGILLI